MKDDGDKKVETEKDSDDEDDKNAKPIPAFDQHRKEDPINQLVYAALKGCKIIVKTLLKKGVNINYFATSKSPDIADHTPLHAAAAGEHEHIARLLINNRANPRQSSRRLDTALHVACENSQTNIVRLLLDANKTDINNCYNDERKKPLMCACLCGNLDIIKALLDAKANVDAQALG